MVAVSVSYGFDRGFRPLKNEVMSVILLEKNSARKALTFLGKTVMTRMVNVLSFKDAARLFKKGRGSSSQVEI